MQIRLPGDISLLRSQTKAAWVYNWHSRSLTSLVIKVIVPW